MATFCSIYGIWDYRLPNRQTFLGVVPPADPDCQIGWGTGYYGPVVSVPNLPMSVYEGRAHSIGKPKGGKRDTHFHKDWSAIRRPYSGIGNLLRLCGWSITFIYWNQCISRGYREENAFVDLGKGGKT